MSSRNGYQPNPIGDIDYFPFDAADVDVKLEALIGEVDTGRIREVIAELPAGDDVRHLFTRLSTL